MTLKPQALESSALKVGMIGNLAMGAAGVLASVLSNSQALLVDGLFSLVGFFAAIVATKVSRQSSAAPDETRPFGYAADEAVFTTFRSLSLLGLVAFAFVNACTKIASYAGGVTPPPVRFEIVGIYTVVICLICFGLWFTHQRAWKKSGKKSDILQLEARAAAFDGAITGTAGAGFVLIYFLQNGPLAVIAPIGDAIIVICLCLVAVGTYWKDFTNSIGELVGVSASTELVAKVRDGIAPMLQAEDLELVDVAVVKAGRTLSAVAYVDPKKELSGQRADEISTKLNAQLSGSLGQVAVLVVVSAAGRSILGETSVPEPETGA